MKISRIVLWLTSIIVGIAEVLIALRVVLKLFGASDSATFVRWVYETTAPLLRPFNGMFPTPKIDGIFIVEFSALFALVVYAIVGYILNEIVSELDYRSEKREKRTGR